MRVLLGMVMLCLAVSGSAMAGDLMPKTSETGVKYYAGGVGSDQREALAKTFGTYSLRVETALKGGAYTADVQLRIYAADGSKQLDVVMEGPILVADLPPGQYRLEADQYGEQQTRKVSVKGGTQTKVSLLWSPPASYE